MNQSVTNRNARNKSNLARSPIRSLLTRGIFDEMFDQYLTDSNSEMSNLMNVTMDVAETEHAFEVSVDLPGINPDEVDIQIDNNTLIIRGSRSTASEETDEKKQFHRIERYSGSFSRSIVLPNTINEDETAAEFKDGVLKIVIPKSQEAKPRKISISK